MGRVERMFPRLDKGRDSLVPDLRQLHGIFMAFVESLDLEFREELNASCFLLSI